MANTVGQWKAVLATGNYETAKLQAELLLRHLQAYRPQTKVHEDDANNIASFIAAIVMKTEEELLKK